MGPLQCPRGIRSWGDSAARKAPTELDHGPIRRRGEDGGWRGHLLRRDHVQRGVRHPGSVELQPGGGVQVHLQGGAGLPLRRHGH